MRFSNKLIILVVLLLMVHAIPSVADSVPKPGARNSTVAQPSFSGADFWREQEEIPLDVTVLQYELEDDITWQALVYTSEFYRGAPMRIFAFYAYPNAKGRHPAVVSIHGGGGNADLERAKEFARAGYACLSFDWNTWGEPLVTWKPGMQLPAEPYSIYANLDYQERETGQPDRKTEAGNQRQNRNENAVAGAAPNEQTAVDDPAGEAWGMQFFELGPDGKKPVLYRATMAARRALTWLEQRPEVDAQRLSVAGQSWGGFVAQLLAGIDPRIKAVVSTAASGGWAERYAVGQAMHLQRLSPQDMKLWCRRYDPATYIDRIKAPLLLRLAASDFFGSIDSVAKYWPQISAPKVLQLSPSDNHFALNDVATIVAWLNRCFKGQAAFVDTSRIAFSATPAEQGAVKVQIPATNGVTGASISWTTAPGAWDKRAWAQRGLVLQKTDKANNAGDMWVGTFRPVQAGGPLRMFVSIRDANGNVSSSVPIIRPVSIAAEVSSPKVLSIPVQSVPVSIHHTQTSPLENAQIWQKIPVVGPIARGREVVGEQSMYLQTLWDSQALYLRVEVDDPSPWQPAPNGVPWWNGDSLHLRLRTETNAARNDVPEFEQRVLHLAWYPHPQRPGASAFVARGKYLTNVVRDLSPLTSSVIRVSPQRYEFTTRLPWSFLDSTFKPEPNRSIRFALLAAHGDVLLPEVAGGAILNQAQELHKPEAWGTAILVNREE